MAKKRKARKRKSKLSTCATSLGRRGGKRTLALGHGIFADVYIRKRKKSSYKKVAGYRRVKIRKKRKKSRKRR